MELKPKLVTVDPPATRNLQHPPTDIPSPNTVMDTLVMNTPSPITVTDTSPSPLTPPAFTITNPIRHKRWTFLTYSTKILHSKMPTWDTISANLQNQYLFKLFELYFYYGSDNLYVSERGINILEIRSPLAYFLTASLSRAVQGISVIVLANFWVRTSLGMYKWISRLTCGYDI